MWLITNVEGDKDIECVSMVELRLSSSQPLYRGARLRVPGASSGDAMIESDRYCDLILSKHEPGALVVARRALDCSLALSAICAQTSDKYYPLPPH